MLRRELAICLLIVITLISVTGSGYAEGTEGGKKLEKGVIQITTCLIDIPKAIYQESKASNPLVGLPVGILKGGANMFAHLFSGFFNIATCMFPKPQMDAEIFEVSPEQSPK